MVGDRLRRARLRNQMSVRQMAEKAGLSKTSIVQAEAGRTSRVSTYEKMSQALGLRFDVLCLTTQSSEQPFSVHREGDEMWYGIGDFSRGGLPDQSPEGRRKSAESGTQPFCIIAARLHGGHLQPTMLELYGKTTPRSHPGEEFVLVMSGTAILRIGEEDVVLKEGESVNFWSGEPHSYGPAEGSELPVRILSVRLDP